MMTMAKIIEHLTLGRGQRFKGLSLPAWLAAGLDPRTKSFNFLSDSDSGKNKIADVIRVRALRIYGVQERSVATVWSSSSATTGAINTESTDMDSFDPTLFAPSPPIQQDMSASSSSSDEAVPIQEQLLDVEWRLFLLDPGIPLGKPAESDPLALEWWKNTNQSTLYWLHWRGRS